MRIVARTFLSAVAQQVMRPATGVCAFLGIFHLRNSADSWFRVRKLLCLAMPHTTPSRPRTEPRQTRRRIRPQLTWYVDLVMFAEMKTVIVSQFKAQCIAMLKQVKQTGEPLTVTLRGKPLARIEPVGPASGTRVIGAQKAGTRTKEDLVRVDFASEWECSRR